MKIEVTNKGKIFQNAKEIKPYIRPDKGTMVVRINGKRKGLATLVAKAFVPNPFNYRNVIFIDRNRLNCDASNLDWMSNSEYKIYCQCGKKMVYGTKNEAIQKAKCEHLKKFYQTGNKEYLLKSWIEAIKKIWIYEFDKLSGYIWEYFQDRAMRFSLYDPHYLIILYSKRARQLIAKESLIRY